MLCQQRINARVVCTGRQQAMPAGLVRARVSRGSRVVVEARSNALVQSSVVSRALAVANRGSRALRLVVSAVKDGAALDRPLRVAVIGGGPSGACAAETLAKGGVETFLLERKLDNCKVTAAAMESRRFPAHCCMQQQQCCLSIALKS
jgi:geranylgeranyl reductase